MFEQQASKKVLIRSLRWMLFICMSVLFLVACGSSVPGSSSNPGAAPTTAPAPSPTTAPTLAPTTVPTPSPTLTPFKVIGVDMAVNPKSLAGWSCGTATTVTYTATFHIAANSPGGTIHFLYTWNNGRGSPSASVTVGPGQTTATYSYTWSGNLPADHTVPGNGGVMVTSPNALTSSLVKPDGMCS